MNPLPRKASERRAVLRDAVSRFVVRRRGESVEHFDKFAQELLQTVLNNDLGGFQEQLRRRLELTDEGFLPLAQAGPLWIDLSGRRESRRPQVVDFTLPPKPPAKPPATVQAPPAQTVVLVDSGGSAVGRVSGGSALKPAELRASLEFSVGGDTNVQAIFADRLVVEDGKDVVVEFPTLAPLKPTLGVLKLHGIGEKASTYRTVLSIIPPKPEPKTE